MTPFIKNALTLLNADRLSDAITYIRKYLIAQRNTRALDSLQSIYSTYTYLLKYLVEGQPDPEREKMYADIREKLYSIVRSIEVDQEMKDSPLLYYSLSRNNNYSQRNFSEAFGRYISASSEELFTDDESDLKRIYTEKDRALKDIFSLVWTLPIGYAEEIKSIANVASGRDTDPELASLIMSAITLNLLTVYDRDKFIALIDILTKDISDELYARILVGVVLILDKYSKRVVSDPQLSSRFEVLSDSPLFTIRAKEAVYGLVKARGGINLMRKIESEILPDIMKVGPEMLNKFKDNEGAINLESLEMNPEWDKIMNGKMGKKLRKLSDIQSDGGDIMLSTFSHMVNNFHFFNDIDVWFRLYTEWEGKRLGLSDNFVSVWKNIPQSGLCDTDKYLMTLNMARLPESTRNFMTQGMNAQTEQMMEDMKSMQIKNQDVNFELAVSNYSRVLFRFYNFFRLKGEFINPFGKPMNIEELPFIGRLIADEETLSEIGEYYFRQGFYEDSISIFNSLMEISPLERYIYCQKIGFAYEKLNKFDEALRYYTDSSLDGNTDEWLLKKIRNAAQKTRDISNLNRSLTELLKNYPEDINYLKELIKLKIDNPKYDNFSTEDNTFEADKLISKLYYLAPEDFDTLLLRAEKSLMNGDFNKAEDSISSLLDEVSMYLAAASLSTDVAKSDFTDFGKGFGTKGESESFGNEGNDVFQRASESEEMQMSEILLMAGSIELGKGNEGDAIKLFSQIHMLENAQIKRSQIRDRLISLWSRSEKLIPRITSIPLYLEAVYMLKNK